MYRDDQLACTVRARVLEKEIKKLRRDLDSPLSKRLRQRLRREHRAVLWAKRRLGPSYGWLVPRSLAEVMVAFGIALTCITLASGVLYFVACLVLLV